MHAKKIKTLLKKSLYKVNRNPLTLAIFRDLIKKRAQLKLTDFADLAENISFFLPYSEEIHMPNDFYGHATVLKNFLGLPRSFKFRFTIEHGIVVSDYLNDLELESDFKTIAVSSIYRKKVWEKEGYKSFAIGPFIHYAEHYLSLIEIQKEKKRLGKTLLVFPSHSTATLDDSYDINSLCDQIKKVSKNFKSTRVCLYWKDIQNGAADIYLKEGFEVVSAGHILDPNFLPRLKSIIELSDFTLSNDVGSHIGYCVLMNKPHMIISQKHKFKGIKEHMHHIDYTHKAKPYQEILKAFTKKAEGITKEQKEVVERYWGISEIKTEKELLNIISDI